MYNQDPATRGKFDFLFDNFPQLNSDFNGADFTVQKRLSHDWMVLGGLSLGRNIGDIYGTADLNNPNYTFRRGPIEFDVPVSLKLSGVYQLPYRLAVSGNFQHFTGFPEEDQVVVGSNTVALTQVTQTIDIAERGTNRLPSVNVGDFAVKRLFRLTHGTTVEPAMELFNVGNANTVQGRLTTLGPAYHRATSIMRGRMLRFGVNFKF